jgi:cytochrome b subunit of formate dehydrogenase
MRPAKDPSSSVHPSHLLETCGNCHVEQRTALRKGVHHASGPRNELGAGTPLDCGKCHGQDAHGILPVKDPSSPVALDHQVQTCGSCHEKFLATYEVSVHGQGLRKSGLLVTAVCADCHRAHDIYYAADKRSSLHATNVATTCGKCHAFVEERLDHSVHGAGGGPGSPSPRPPPGGEGPRRPSCVDCHQGHDHPRPETAQFRLQVPHRCGNCHADYALRYGMSLHGQLTRLGYEPAAKCADCHGDHDILPVSHSTSHLATGRRAETCRQCHPKATSNFALFDPHADHHDAGRYPLLHSVYAYTEVFLYWGFGFFLLHAVLWFARSLIHTLRFGRHQRLTGAEPGVIRFAPVDRLLYVLMLVAFLGLMLTGMPLKYSGEPWAHRLANALGGFDSTSFWHRAFATLIIGTAVTHLVRLVKWGWGMHQQQMGWKSSLFGPDSPVPNWRDFRDLAGMARWFLGLDRKPRFERWTYWEKFDYWAVVVTMVLIGGSGLLLALPHLFTRFLPGSVLNVAQVLHSETALMVAGCVFIIHFFNTHLRPEKFPMDLSLFTGVISEEHLRMARPEYLERLRQEGKLEQMRTLTPPRSRLRRAVFAGFVVIVLGLLLLLASLVAYLGK